MLQQLACLSYKWKTRGSNLVSSRFLQPISALLSESSGTGKRPAGGC